MAGILSHPARYVRHSAPGAFPALIPWKAYLPMRQKTILSSVDAIKMVAAAKIDGAGNHTPEIATLKARTSATFRTPTKALEDVAKDRPATIAFPHRLPVQGG